jgi:hypothetical protein
MKVRHLTRIALCMGLWLIGNACTKPAPSEIVATAEKAGSGDLSATPTPKIEDWLRKRPEFAVQVDDMCKPVRDKADANWPASTEGRVCAAARNASVVYRQLHTPKPKGETFGPGLH